MTTEVTDPTIPMVKLNGDPREWPLGFIVLDFVGSQGRVFYTGTWYFRFAGLVAHQDQEEIEALYDRAFSLLPRLAASGYLKELPTGWEGVPPGYLLTRKGQNFRAWYKKIHGFKGVYLYQ